MASDMLANSKLSIFGLGLMGGSLALALSDHCSAIFGYDPDPKARLRADNTGVFVRVSNEPAEILSESDAIILSAPVRSILQIIQELPELHPGSAIVLDIGSTKKKIVEGYKKLPPRFDPIGGHPMCGKEQLTLANSDPSIFQGAPFAFTPLERTSSKAHEFALQVADTIGALPIWLDAETHDRWVSATSHLPYILSVVLCLSTPSEAFKLTGPGFRSTTRLAATPTSIMIDILTTNRENVLRSLNVFREQLDNLEEALGQNNTLGLEKILSQGSSKREKMLNPINTETAK